MDSEQIRPLVEITKESVRECANAYAEGQTSENFIEPVRLKILAKTKKDWYAGFLAHAQMMEPHNADLVNRFDNIIHNTAEARLLITAIERVGFECEGGPLKNNMAWLALKEFFKA